METVFFRYGVRQALSIASESANTHDSLAETYADLGNQALATKNYKCALALNPKNAAAAAYLKKLQHELLASRG